MWGQCVIPWRKKPRGCSPTTSRPAVERRQVTDIPAVKSSGTDYQPLTLAYDCSSETKAQGFQTALLYSALFQRRFVASSAGNRVRQRGEERAWAARNPC
jgi:hypothetical protein